MGDERRDMITGDSISGRSAALYFEHAPSLASLLVSHDIQVRDFIMLSFLADQGLMSATQLAHAVGIEPESLMNGMKRLSEAGLMVGDSISICDDSESVLKITARGQDVAKQIHDQL